MTFVATLTSAPGARVLDPATAEALRNAWGGGALRWLAPREAAEFALPARPDNFDTAGEELRARGLDLALQPAEGRRKRLLLADMDSTMIGQECIDELAAEAGVGARVAEITARAMNGELDFEGALTERVALLAGLEESVIARVLESRITLAPGGRVLVATMRAGGAHTALVSGGFTAFTGPVAARLGFDEHRANRLIIEGGRLTGQVAQPILGRAAKVAALEELCARLGIESGAAMAVGDGANDLGMLERAGAGVALNAKPVVARQAAIRIDHGDLTALLYLQGYAREEFVVA
ncbi:MAG: phosphoserine phosphatase SerB [Alphaproteobacteria bacterium HGW-Alphaproteobacteria-2]|nr:MAG: phosphoserine phosphatase SerB [Alphaproteobacteria bacterium HGW-Alphaproteobacteria-2]